MAATYRIVMLVGDDFGDFYPKAGELSVAERLKDMSSAPAADWWGRRWFMLPNPMYGSWERVLGIGLEGGPTEHPKHREINAFPYPQ